MSSDFPRATSLDLTEDEEEPLSLEHAKYLDAEDRALLHSRRVRARRERWSADRDAGGSFGSMPSVLSPVTHSFPSSPVNVAYLDAEDQMLLQGCQRMQVRAGLPLFRAEAARRFLSEVCAQPDLISRLTQDPNACTEVLHYFRAGEQAELVNRLRTLGLGGLTLPSALVEDCSEEKADALDDDDDTFEVSVFGGAALELEP